jgi:phenol/toluene 2-monooxygenase (NADH) P5/A5
MAEHIAAVTEIEELAPSVVQLTIKFTDDFQFEPGQYVNFRFPEGVSRAYTIASAPERPDEVQLCVRVGAGKGGTALKALSPGASVTVDGPFGEFVLPQHDGRPVAFLAGDTGIAPVRSIVLHMLATKDKRPITVLYEPDQRHILYAADFDPLARDGSIVHESGKVETLIARNRKRLEKSLKMVVGFDGFLARVQSAMRANGLEPSEAIVESFGPEP